MTRTGEILMKDSNRATRLALRPGALVAPKLASTKLGMPDRLLH